MPVWSRAWKPVNHQQSNLLLLLFPDIPKRLFNIIIITHKTYNLVKNDEGAFCGASHWERTTSSKILLHFKKKYLHLYQGQTYLFYLFQNIPKGENLKTQ